MTTRLLETGFDTKFHALQIIFVRMSITATIGSVYLWRKGVADFPFGPRGVRGLLVVRGLSGTVGLFGLYCAFLPPTSFVVDLDVNWCRRVDSLSFLDIADATVITFLVPTLTGFVCWIALRVRTPTPRLLVQRAYTDKDCVYRNHSPSEKPSRASLHSQASSSLRAQQSSLTIYPATHPHRRRPRCSW